MINTRDILETIHMIEDENLDIRTITMGISLLDCCSQDIDDSCRRVYDKIARKAEKLVRVGCEIEKEYGVPIINKRIAVTPIAMLAAASGGDPVKYALTLEKAAQAVGVNFIGGYSALVQKGFAPGDEALIKSIPEALARTEHVCSSVNIGSWRSWAKSSEKQPSSPPTTTASARRSSSYSATPPRITRSWRAHSTAPVNRRA